MALAEILRRPNDRAPMITISGESGVGKTTLAALFPKPCCIRTEDGVEALPHVMRPYSFPMSNSSADVLSYINMLTVEKHPFQTLILDSVTQLASVIEAEIMASDKRNPASINQALGGYGAGRSAAGAKHRAVVNACVKLNAKRSMAIVFVAHSVVESFDPPDGEPFNRYVLRMDRLSTQPYIDLVDAVAFVRVKTKMITKEDSKKIRAKSSNERVIIAYPTGAHVAKNRYGIEEPIDWNDKTRNPLLPFIPFYN